MAYNFYDYMIGEIEEHKEQEENITLKQIIKISALLVEIEEIEETILYIEEKINKLQETKEDVKDYIQKIEDLQELKEFAKNKIQEIKDLHPIWEYIYNQNKEKLHKNEPFKITINNQTYTHIKNTETFYLSESSQKITVLNLMKRTLPNVTKSLYKRIIPPDEIYDFSNSTRLKIIKAAQLNYCEPPINEDTRQFTPLFKHLSENVQDCYYVRQQYQAARFAAQWNDELATSLILHYGWGTDFKMPMRGSSIHSLTITEQGILIDIINSHSFQERLHFACCEVLLYYRDWNRRENYIDREPLSKKIILQKAIRIFYYYKETYISITDEYRKYFLKIITEYIENLINPLNKDKTDIILPKIEEPDIILPNKSILLKYNDFIFEDGVSAAQLKQRDENGEQNAKSAILNKLVGFSRDKIYKRSELPLYDNNLKSGLKYGLLEKHKYGYYKILIHDDE